VSSSTNSPNKGDKHGVCLDGDKHGDKHGVCLDGDKHGVCLEERQMPSPQKWSQATSPLPNGVLASRRTGASCTADRTPLHGQSLGNRLARLTSGRLKSSNKASDGPFHSAQSLPSPESKVRAYQNKLRLLQDQMGHSPSSWT
jgi:hypothetical protein